MPVKKLSASISFTCDGCVLGREEGAHPGETRLCHKKAAACSGSCSIDRELGEPVALLTPDPHFSEGMWSDFAACFPPFEQPQQQRWWRGLWLCCEMLVCHPAVARGVYRM